MDTPKIKTKKRGLSTITKTVTKGVNDQGKRYRTVKKTTTNPISNSSATTTKTRVGGPLKKAYKSGNLDDKPVMFIKKQKPEDKYGRRDTYYEAVSKRSAYKVAKGKQREMVKAGKEQDKFTKNLAKKAIKMKSTYKPKTITTYTPY